MTKMLKDENKLEVLVTYIKLIL